MSELLVRRIMKLRGILRLSAVALAAVIFGSAAQSASAQSKLTYSLEVSAVQGSGSFTSDGKSVTLPNGSTGQVVTLNVYAILHGVDTDSANDGVLNVVGSFNAKGALTGLLRGDTGTTGTTVNNVAGFTGPTSQSGFRIDADGLGALDIGRDSVWKTAPTDDAADPGTLTYFVATSTNSGAGLATFGTGTTASHDTKLLVGQTTFSVSGNSGSATLQFIPHLPGTGSANSKRNQKFTVDGVDLISDAAGSNSTATGLLDLGAPVSVSFAPVPEPTSIALSGIAVMGLLMRRRRAA